MIRILEIDDRIPCSKETILRLPSQTTSARFLPSAILVIIIFASILGLSSCAGYTVPGNASVKTQSVANVSVQITTLSLPVGTVGASYSISIQSSGGTSPYSWTITTGALPTGLTLGASSGVISGTPTVNGNASFTVQVIDSANNSTTKSLTISITPAGIQPLAITAVSLPQASTSGAYSTTLQATGGTPGYTWSITSGSFPAGLALMASSGQITGTASTAGSSSFTVQVKDSAANPATATQNFTLAVANGTSLDQYGGRTDIKCSQATGWFHTEKLASRWWLCTPAGNAFYAQMMSQVISPDSTYNSVISSKYGGTMPWTTATNKRLVSWGFNSLTSGTYLYNLPIGSDVSFPLDSNGIYSQPVKMPFTVMVRPALYAMSNPVIGSSQLLTNPVKNMIYVHSPYYTGYVASGGVADYYDSGIGTWLQKDLQVDFQFSMLNASPYKNYVIGFTSDDGDEMNGFGAGPDFPTNPTGYGGYNLAMQVAAMSPIETANSSFGFDYTDTLIHSKKALRDLLVSKYGTVAALNAAWGSSYTTFDSSGLCVGSQPITCASSVSADSVGTGNGSTTTFNTTLSHTVVSSFTLQILAAGTPVAGDMGNGTLYGPNVSGSINYSTGALSITFASGTEPTGGVTITASYIANGWGTGTGLLDEDNRPSHNSYMGTDWMAMSNAHTTTVADLNTFYQALAGQYFSTCQTQLKAIYPNIMYLGPDSLSTWNAPSAAPVLKAAGQYLDAFLTAGSVVFTQPEMDFIEQNFGDKPYFGSFYSSANPDSPLAASPNNAPPIGFATQAARGQGYYNMMSSQLQTSHTTAGNYPYVGVYFWEYADNWGEKLNWGLVTHLDNAYDGHEDVTATVSCSAPLQTLTCGNEPGNYGDVITSVKTGNALWLGSIQ